MLGAIVLRVKKHIENNKDNVVVINLNASQPIFNTQAVNRSLLPLGILSVVLGVTGLIYVIMVGLYSTGLEPLDWTIAQPYYDGLLDLSFGLINPLMFILFNKDYRKHLKSMFR